MLIIIEIIVGISVSLACAKLFVEITDWIFVEKATSLDIFISQQLYRAGSPAVTSMMEFFTQLGSVYFLLPATIIVTAFIYWKKHKRDAILFVFTMGFGWILNLVAKVMFGRARPTTAALLFLDTFSYPSSHAMMSTIFYTSVAYFVFHYTRNKKLGVVSALTAAVLILLIGFSRIYLGAHYFSDVLAGYIAGLGWAVTIISVHKTTGLIQKIKNTGRYIPIISLYR